MSKRIATILALLVIAIPFLSACGGDTTPATAVPVANTAVPPTTAPVANTAVPATVAPTIAANTAVPPTSGTTSGGKLQVIWFAWPPCDALGQLVKGFPGGQVEVRCVPIDQWHSQIFTDFVAQAGADIVILDSQFIGEATSAHTS